ncbi:MAG: hypothetical protein IT355_10400 [Gemmatimonadaceae bacterium]|nr:hypothetical protein [Gemmatimonadaceae bacterium]
MDVHVRRAAQIVLDGPVERVFPMFTPLGECAWVPGWAPQFIRPADGRTAAGMVFRTGEADELTLWACCDWEPGQQRVRYARVTPASRFGFVEVRCTAATATTTTADVAYDLTALTPAGVKYLDEFTAAAFGAMLAEWQVRIDGWLAANPAAIVRH